MILLAWKVRKKGKHAGIWSAPSELQQKSNRIEEGMRVDLQDQMTWIWSAKKQRKGRVWYGKYAKDRQFLVI